MKVGLDVAPLLQTRAGTARWVRGLHRGLVAHPDVELTPLSWGGPGRWTAVARDVLWYPALLPRQAAKAHVDVLHCTIFRAPPRALRSSCASSRASSGSSRMSPSPSPIEASLCAAPPPG